MKISESVIYRCVAGEHMLIPVGNSALENNGLVALNEIGGEIWKLLSAGKETEEIVVAIAEEYDAEIGVIRRDVQELLQKLVKLGFLLDE